MLYILQLGFLYEGGGHAILDPFQFNETSKDDLFYLARIFHLINKEFKFNFTSSRQQFTNEIIQKDLIDWRLYIQQETKKEIKEEEDDSNEMN